ncbi:uncharacterized protein UBRO_20246 [Ustilago bromivora]|uniref:Endonuclease/exonuclease/phosphatase domain-containing protein n=1 Tax=Ustilago bromivora TaxID=307758 RepID=A0A1K0FWT3_9BASI|nr:uncharacterized protein UBRO_20246 [Ustilago bromivora]
MTWNCNGLNASPVATTGDWKQSTGGIDVVLIQETCNSSDHHTLFDPTTLLNILAHPDMSSSVHASYLTPFCGIAILNPNISMRAAKHSLEQRIVSANLHYHNRTITVASVYAPASHYEHREFFNTFPMRSIVSEHPVILGGDWNDAPSALDLLNGRPPISHLWHIIDAYTITYSLFDPLRILRSEDHLYTRIQHTQNGLTASCIDFFLVSADFLHHCHNIDILRCFASNHSPVILTSQLGPEEEESDSTSFLRWRLPQTIARYGPFVDAASQFIEQTANQVLNPERGIRVNTTYI